MRITVKFKGGGHYHSNLLELIAVAHSNKNLFRRSVWEKAQKIVRKLQKQNVEVKLDEFLFEGREVSICELVAVAHAPRELFKKRVWEDSQNIMRGLEKKGILIRAYPSTQKYLILKKALPEKCKQDKFELFRWLAEQYVGRRIECKIVNRESDFKKLSKDYKECFG